MSLNAEIELARQAAECMKNPALTEAFNRYRDKVVSELQACDPLNVAMVLTLKRHLTSLSIVRKNLEIMVADGLEAQKKLDFERETIAQRAKNAMRRVV